MALKFLLTTLRPLRYLPKWKVVEQGTTLFPQTMTVRSAGDMIPPTQYDVTRGPRFRMGYVLTKHWETIPLFVCTFVSMALAASSAFWCLQNKVDVVFRSRSRDNVSRTMDLRNPSVHKVIIINQKYEPWPQMYEVLDKMKAEHFKRMDYKRSGKC